MSGRRLLFIPMYNCAPQIGRTLAQLTPERQAAFAEVFVLDNGSTDGGPDRAVEAGRTFPPGFVTVARNTRNVGLGGSHKVAFERCLERGLDGVVVLHGDDQGELGDLLPALLEDPKADNVLGARFAWGSRLKGYAPHRILANFAFNLIFSLISFRWLTDLGSGLNWYSASFLKTVDWAGCSDDLTFNYHLILRSCAKRDLAMRFVPIGWREDDQVSNAKLFRHGISMLRIVARHVFDRKRFLTSDHSTHAPPRTYEVLGP